MKHGHLSSAFFGGSVWIVILNLHCERGVNKSQGVPAMEPSSPMVRFEQGNDPGKIALHVFVAEMQIQQRQSLNKRPFFLVNQGFQLRVGLFLHSFKQLFLGQKTREMAEEKAQHTSDDAADDCSDNAQPRVSDSGTEEYSHDRPLKLNTSNKFIRVDRVGSRMSGCSSFMVPVAGMIVIKRNC
jgi:hypothetical protein